MQRIYTFLALLTIVAMMVGGCAVPVAAPAAAPAGAPAATEAAAARKKQADGEATYIAETGRAKAAEVEAVGLARAKGFEAQVRALGQGPTAVINVTTALAERGVKIMPEILAIGGGGSLEGVAATLMKFLNERVSSPSGPAAIVDSGPEKPSPA